MDIPILRYLDVLIGVAVVMLLGATVVMAVTQLYLNSTYVRARCLRDGLAELIHMLNPERLGADATYISERLLRYPMAGRPNTSMGNMTGHIRNWLRIRMGKTPLPRVNPAEVIEREEFCFMLLEWAAGEGPLGDQDRKLSDDDANKPEARGRVDAVRASVESAVKQGGFSDPGSILRMVRARAVENERADPGKRAFEWRSAALMDLAAADLTNRVLAWYDNSMQRVTDRFALHAKVAGSVLSLVLAFSLHLDTIDLARNLSQDAAFRQALVNKSDSALRAYEEVTKNAAKPGQTIDENAVKQIKAEADTAMAQLREIQSPVHPPEMMIDWKQGNRFPSLDLSRLNAKTLPGILLTWILLSLGAPFWYDLLKRLLGLRSIIAKKEEEDREARVEEQKTLPITSSTPPVPVETLSTDPGLVEIRSQASVRSGRPSQQSPIVRMVDADTLVSIKGAVRGQAVVNSTGQSIDKWFVTTDDDFLWAGATDQP